MQRSMEGLRLTVLLASPSDGRILFANRAVQRLLDCSEEKLLDRRVADIDAAHQDDGWREFFDELRKVGAVERQTVLLNKSDQALAVDMDCSVTNLDGEEYIFLFVRHISESLEAARILDAQLTLITDWPPIWIARVDRNLRHTYVNKGYERLFGRKRKELVGQRLEDVLGVNNIADLRPIIKRVFLRETVTFERALFQTALCKRVIRGTFSPDTLEEGLVVGYFVLGQDITAETEVREARELSEARAILAKSHCWTPSKAFRLVSPCSIPTTS